MQQVQRKKEEMARRTDPPGTFGFLGVGPNLERTATPYSYLQRIALMNQAFGSDIRVEGITPGDKPSIITSEPYYKPDDPESPHPSPDEVEQFMRSNGFERLPNVPDGWSRKSDGIKVYDARPENFIKTKDAVVPVDLVLQRGQPTVPKK